MKRFLDGNYFNILENLLKNIFIFGFKYENLILSLAHSKKNRSKDLFCILLFPFRSTRIRRRNKSKQKDLKKKKKSDIKFFPLNGSIEH